MNWRVIRIAVDLHELETRDQAFFVPPLYWRVTSLVVQSMMLTSSNRGLLAV